MTIFNVNIKRQSVLCLYKQISSKPVRLRTFLKHAHIAQEEHCNTFNSLNNLKRTFRFSAPIIRLCTKLTYFKAVCKEKQSALNEYATKQS